MESRVWGGRARHSGSGHHDNKHVTRASAGNDHSQFHSVTVTSLALLRLFLLLAEMLVSKPTTLGSALSGFRKGKFFKPSCCLGCMEPQSGIKRSSIAILDRTNKACRYRQRDKAKKWHVISLICSSRDTRNLRHEEAKTQLRISADGREQGIPSQQRAGQSTKV